MKEDRDRDGCNKVTVGNSLNYWFVTCLESQLHASRFASQFSEKMHLNAVHNLSTRKKLMYETNEWFLICIVQTNNNRKNLQCLHLSAGPVKKLKGFAVRARRKTLFVHKIFIIQNKLVAARPNPFLFYSPERIDLKVMLKSVERCK